MHALTQQLVSELDLLYGLYMMAVDLTKKINPEDEKKIQRVLEARVKILERTGTASKEVVKLLKAFQAEKMIPENEKALVEEKRSLVLDLGVKIQSGDQQMTRLMYTKLSVIRKELANQTQRTNVIKAYIQAPRAQLAVQ